MLLCALYFLKRKLVHEGAWLDQQDLVRYVLVVDCRTRQTSFWIIAAWFMGSGTKPKPVSYNNIQAANKASLGPFLLFFTIEKAPVVFLLAQCTNKNVFNTCTSKGKSADHQGK